MYKSVIISSGFHIAIIFLAALSLPFISKKPIELPPLISIESSLLSNFLFNNFWTFKKREVSSSLYKRLLQFHLASGGAACLNYLTFLLAFAVLGMHDILSNLLGITVAAILNYLINCFPYSPSLGPPYLAKYAAPSKGWLVLVEP